MENFNLFEHTKHDTGIIVWSTGEVAVSYWGNWGNNKFPLISPCGDIIAYPVDDISIDEGELHEDLRGLLPGRVWKNEQGEIVTDLDIVFDVYGDIPAMFGFKTFDTDPQIYADFKQPYKGKAYNLRSGQMTARVLCIDWWS